MTKAADVKGFAQELRPHIEAAIDSAEILKGLAAAARAKGIDWSALKALVKAQALDARDGTDKRVAALIEKADFAASYADILGFASANMNNFSKSRSSSPASIDQHSTDPDARIVSPASRSEVGRKPDHGQRSDSDQNAQSIPPVSGSEKLQRQLQASIAIADAGDLPDFLDRRRPQ